MSELPSPADASAERTYSGVAVAERAAQRRQRFIEAGIELFGTVGYHATTMRTITAATGLTNRYFYESFTTMEDLLVACYEQLMADYRERLSQVLDAAAGGVELRLRAGLTCFFEAMTNPQFAQVTHREVLGVSPRVDELYSRHMGEFAELMMEYLERAGVPIASHDPREMALVGAALAGSAIHAAAAWVRSRYSAPIGVVVEATLKIFLGAVGQLQAPRS